MSDPHLFVMTVVIILSMLAALLLWLIPSPCTCEKCAFHVNERRMARERQKEVRHDVAHKGFGFKDGDKDSFKCGDAACDRNPQKVD